MIIHLKIQHLFLLKKVIKFHILDLVLNLHFIQSSNRHFLPRIAIIFLLMETLLLYKWLLYYWQDKFVY